MKENLTLLLPSREGTWRRFFRMGDIWAWPQKKRRPFQAKDRACIQAEKSESTRQELGKVHLTDVYAREGRLRPQKYIWALPGIPASLSCPVSTSTSCWHLWGFAVKVMAFIDLREFAGNIGHRIIWGLWLPPPTQAWDFKIQALSPILTLSYGKSITLLA